MLLLKPLKSIRKKKEEQSNYCCLILNTFHQLPRFSAALNRLVTAETFRKVSRIGRWACKSLKHNKVASCLPLLHLLLSSMCFTHSSATRGAFNYLPELQTQQHEGPDGQPSRQEAELAGWRSVSILVSWEGGGDKSARCTVLHCRVKAAHECPRC